MLHYQLGGIINLLLIISSDECHELDFFDSFLQTCFLLSPPCDSVFLLTKSISEKALLFVPRASERYRLE